MIEELRMTSLRFLFLSILKLGASAYGGPGMISQIKETAIDRYGWVKEGEFMRGVALCQLIPGAIMVHIVTYIGYRVRGIWGALTAAVAFVLPAFVALLALSAIYFKFHGLWFMESLFRGLGAIVIAILLNACITFGKSVLKDWKVIVISVFSFFAFLFHLNIVLIFVLAAVAGLLLRPETVQTKALPPGGPRRETGEENPRLILLALAACIAVVLGLCYLIDPRIAHVSLSLSKIGAVAFGAFTAIPLIQHDMVDRLHWLTTKELLDGIALGCVTPGPIMITATFVGYKVAGFLGASMATLGVFFPSFFILVLLIPYHDRLRGVAKVQMMEQGVLGSFIGILALVLYNFGRTSLVDVPSILMASGAFIAIYKKMISLPYILLVGVILSIIFWGLLK
ncbi:MAG TPA: chromate efflux transporter [Syntrophales bacterium]|nr:chromate efflux transporter [Syntrophales bacterium]